MIQANELRTTNLVYTCKGGIETRVGQIFAGMQNEFEPIPLTEEWLLKFGFDFEEWHDTDGFHYKGYKLISPTKYNPCFQIYTGEDEATEEERRFYFDDYPLKHITTVHSLQNLYFALTGEELTIK